MTRQAAAISAILRRESGNGRSLSVLDCTCGIGTQSLGLAELGYHVTGSDLSAGAVQRARAEAAVRALNVPFYVADVRRLDDLPIGGFEAVISMDNALPHLLSDADLAEAARQMRQAPQERNAAREHPRLRPTGPGPPDGARSRILFGLRSPPDHRPGMGLGGRPSAHGSSLHHPGNAFRVGQLPRRYGVSRGPAPGNHSNSCVEWIRKCPLAIPERKRIVPAGRNRNGDRLILESTWPRSRLVDWAQTAIWDTPGRKMRRTSLLRATSDARTERRTGTRLRSLGDADIRVLSGRSKVLPRQRGADPAAF